MAHDPLHTGFLASTLGDEPIPDDPPTGRWTCTGTLRINPDSPCLRSHFWEEFLRNIQVRRTRAPTQERMTPLQQLEQRQADQAAARRAQDRMDVERAQRASEQRRALAHGVQFQREVDDARRNFAEAQRRYVDEVMGVVEQTLPGFIPREDVERTRHEREAEQRAEALLLRHLTEDQRTQYAHDRSIYVRGRSGARYRIRYGTVHNVERLGADNQAVEKLCALPRDGVPIPDVMLTQMLWLQHDDAAFAHAAFRLTPFRF